MEIELGEIRENNKGTKMKIIRCRNREDIDVEFLDEHHYVKHNTTYSNFVRGQIKNPFTPLLKLIHILLILLKIFSTHKHIRIVIIFISDNRPDFLQLSSNASQNPIVLITIPVTTQNSLNGVVIGFFVFIIYLDMNCVLTTALACYDQLFFIF